MTQTQLVKRFIDNNGSITPLQAMSNFGIMRLAARIKDLEKEGMEFRKTMVCDMNRFGQPVRFMKYSKVMPDE